ncbi:class I SAM-dependent methyltransferase [Acaryochloris marina]|uniref:class I SAM-dependent methyltransferase n=1 Tax=Acaryochloris marina TaxID=155978 RepID=UPI000A01E157|nr:methyltransferase domain-containing protein [Acaryochloris marina]
MDPQIAQRLLDHAFLSQGQRVLDLATGTGLVAIDAAQRVGRTGSVIGVDIATDMIECARQKAAALGLTNVDFLVADAEDLNFPAGSFDHLFCSSALIWMSDLPKALRLWHRVLKPGGLLGFHAFAETAFIAGVVAQRVLERQGISVLLNKPTGTVEKCHRLLTQAGFVDIDFKVEVDGSYLSLERLRGMWLGDSSSPAPGQYPNPVSLLSAEQLAAARADYVQELETLQTDQGIWSDSTIFYTYGRKAL